MRQRTFLKSKLLVIDMVIFALIVGGILFVESGPEPWLDSEKVFMARLHNSLGILDGAKQQWVAEKNKAEEAVPTLDDLKPYLGKEVDSIQKLEALGVEYKITSSETNQSEVATLTRGIRFRGAVCPYYRAGTKLCLHTGWENPPASVSPITFRIRLTWLWAEVFLWPALFVWVVANMILVPMIFFPVEKPQSKQEEA